MNLFRPNQYSGAVREVRFTIALVTTSSVSLIPANSLISYAAILITTPYNAGIISLGRAGSTNLLFSIAGTSMSVAGVYSLEQDTDWGGSTLPVVATFSSTAPASGAGFVVVRYCAPNP